jgi:hypothetical protein
MVDIQACLRRAQGAVRADLYHNIFKSTRGLEIHIVHGKRDTKRPCRGSGLFDYCIHMQWAHSRTWRDSRTLKPRSNVVLDASGIVRQIQQDEIGAKQRPKKGI